MLVDYEFFGKGTPGSFDLVDLRLLNNEKWINKLERAFSRTRFDFNIYAYNTTDGLCFGKHPTGGHNVETWAGLYDERMLLQAMDDRLPMHWKTSINYLMIENEGADRIPITPWIVAHRFSHALGYEKYFVDGRIRKLATAMELLYAEYRIHLKRDDESDLDYVHRIGTMRSARNKLYTREGEFLHELMAQHIVGGGVRINCTSERARRFEEGLTRAFDALLTACVGKVVVI